MFASSLLAATSTPQPAATAARIQVAPNTAAADRASFVETERAMARTDRARRATAEAQAAAVVPEAVPVAAVRHTATVRQQHPPRRGATRPGTRRRVAVTYRAVAPEDGSRASIVIAFALAQVGKPYVWAAAGPNSYDCSGLVLASYSRVGISLPHQTGGMIRYGRHVSRAELQPGDVVFPQPGHVAIYLGNGMIVHAPHSGDHVRVAPLYAFYSAVELL